MTTYPIKHVEARNDIVTKTLEAKGQLHLMVNKYNTLLMTKDMEIYLITATRNHNSDNK